jgi:antitoxin FitA
MRAAGNGNSAEEEHRRILHAALEAPRQPRTLKDSILAIPEVGEDSDFERSADLPRHIDV